MGAPKAAAAPSAEAWREPLSPGEPAKNTCVNANKTGFDLDQPCDTPGNSAWTTHSTARTGTQTDALKPPYPDHVLHVQLNSQINGAPSAEAWREPLSPGEPEKNTCVNAN